MIFVLSSSQVHPALSLFPLVTICTVLFVSFGIFKHIGAWADFQIPKCHVNQRVKGFQYKTYLYFVILSLYIYYIAEHYRNPFSFSSHRFTPPSIDICNHLRPVKPSHCIRYYALNLVVSALSLTRLQLPVLSVTLPLSILSKPS